MWFKKSEESAVAVPIVQATEQSIEEQVKAFVGKKSKLIKASDLARQTSLFTSGLLDSLAFVQLVAFLEKTFHMKLPRAIVTTMSNLDTIDQIIPVVLNAKK